VKRWLFIVAVLSLQVLALDEAPASDFEMDKDLVNTLYKDSVTEAKVENYASNGIVVRPKFSYINTQKFELSNDYYNVPYSSTSAALPTMRLEVGTLLTNIAGIELSGLVSAGYSYRESVQQVTAKSGKKFSDLIKTHSLPLNAGVELSYLIPRVPIRPGVSSSVGFFWFYQTGKLDGLEQGFWIPTYQLSGHLSFFEGTTESTSWFKGVQLGTTLYKGFSTAQVFEGWSADLGVGFSI